MSNNVFALWPEAEVPEQRRKSRKSRRHERSKFGTVTRMRSGRFQARFVCPMDGQRYVAPMTFDAAQAGWVWLQKERNFIESDPDGWLPPKVRFELKTAAVAAQTAGDETFAAVAARWLPRHAIRRDKPLTPRTVAEYRRCLDKLLLPAFGDLPMSSFTRRTVDDWYDDFQRENKTQRRHAYQVLKMVMAAAVRDELITVNPCQVELVGTTKPARTVKIPEIELDAIVAAMPEDRRLMVQLGAWCALRFGELAELRRRDIVVAMINGKKLFAINVERGVTRVPIGGRMETVIGPPKSDAGVRVVAVPPHLNDELQDHLDRFVATLPRALLFPAADGESNLAPSTFYGKTPTTARGKTPARPGRGWYRARHLAGRDDLAFHHLRHLGATLAAREGASIADLMSRLGHSTPGAAMRYQHASKAQDEAIAQRMSSSYLGR